MKIQLISDLHLEFYSDPPRIKQMLLEKFLQPADVLVVAGDLQVGRTNVQKWLKWFARYYDQVIYVPGNHEFYNGLTINDFDKLETPANVHCLSPGITFVQGITFIGATLWTNFNEDPFVIQDAQQYIQDFRRAKITPHDMKERFYNDLAFIKKQYEQALGQVVIVTHFLPALECVAPRYRTLDGISSSLNRYFANGLDNWIYELGDATWLFGHTHDAVDIVIGETRCLAAPVGYPGEHQQSYQPLTFEL